MVDDAILIPTVSHIQMSSEVVDTGFILIHIAFSIHSNEISYYRTDLSEVTDSQIFTVDGFSLLKVEP